MRRALVRSLGQVNSSFRHCEAKRRLLNANMVLYDVRYCIGPCSYGQLSYMFSTAISAGAAKENYEGCEIWFIFSGFLYCSDKYRFKCVISWTGFKRTGPLVEYERRISVGELEDGDNCQVHIFTLYSQ